MHLGNPPKRSWRDFIPLAPRTVVLTTTDKNLRRCQQRVDVVDLDQRSRRGIPGRQGEGTLPGARGLESPWGGKRGRPSPGPPRLLTWRLPDKIPVTPLPASPWEREVTGGFPREGGVISSREAFAAHTG